MKRNKVKLVKFLETDDLKKLEAPLYERAKTALQKRKITVPDKIAIRDFVMVNLVYAGALRISEACNLELKDLDLEKKQILKMKKKAWMKYTLYIIAIGNYS